MARRLVTCPVCGVDCHVYRDKLAKHTNPKTAHLGGIMTTCLGTGFEVTSMGFVKTEARREKP